MHPKTTFPLTRQHAQTQLTDFVAHAGQDYAANRNFDKGASRHRFVSCLSPAIRRRLIAEEEVITAVLKRREYAEAEKFIAEVYWRTYWKGWLEQHPTVWHSFKAQAEEGRAALAAQPTLTAIYTEAINGRTGIDCFDYWQRELVETGYLHNWARMQFASIWIFTLRLPWALGAEFTLKHFLDADPASNTLSWRWVAGLHTAGKFYLADGDKIQRMTLGRFNPNGLAKTADAFLSEPKAPAVRPREPRPWNRDKPLAILLTPEDLSLETVPDLHSAKVKCVIAPRNLFQTDADRTAGQDAMERAAVHWDCEANWVTDLEAASLAARDAGVTQLVTGFLPVGTVAENMENWAQTLPQSSLHLGEVQRQWDQVTWPHCAKGFFQLKAKISQLIASLGLDR